MIHIRKTEKKGKKQVESTVCGAALTDGDALVDAALAADCDPCRNLVGVGGKNEKTWEGKTLGVKPEPQWEPGEELK